MPDTFDTERALLGHFLAAIAYRAQKALRGPPPRPDAVWPERPE